MQIDNKNSSPPVQMLLQYHVLKHGLLITAPVSLLAALFIFFTYPHEERLYRAATALCLGCYFIFLYHFAFRRITSMRGMDLLSAVFVLVPTASHAWSIYQHPNDDVAGVMVGLLILASMSFVRHLNFLMFVLASVALVAFASYYSGAKLPMGFWLNTLFVAPSVAFIIRVVVQKNYGLLLERLSNEKQLSAKLAATADALKVSQQDQEQSQIDLKQRETHLSTVLSNTPIMLCVLDRNGVYTHSRGQGLKQLGLSENEIVGREFRELYKKHPDLLSAFNKASQGESSQARVSLAPGLLHEIQFNPVFGEEGELTGVVGVGLDVSESALAERQKQDLEAQLLQAQKMESLGLLASGVAHDFNNYLGAIIAFCELLERQPNAEDAQSIKREAIPVEIKKIAMNASGVCEQMLVFAGKSTHEKVNVDLNSLVDEMKQFFRAIVSHEIELDIELAQHPISVNVNRLLIQQSIVNLLKNACEAIKAQSKRGRIQISTRVVDGLPSECLKGISIGEYDSICQQDSFAVLTVQDNGGGIEATDLQRVFEPYFSSKSNGHGFGLAITAGVIKNHNGLIYCDSGPTGTRVKLVFPVSQLKDTPVSHSLGDSQFSTNAVERVLLIDDEAMITQSIGLVLEGIGYDTTTASSGLSALELIDAGEEYDCIVVDFSMPEMNGLEFLMELRDRQIATPAIMCSGYLELPENAKILPQATLRKPYSIDNLKETIGKVCAAQTSDLAK